MNKIRTLLLEEKSKKIRDEIVRTVLDNHKQMDDLMVCFFDKSLRLNQYASWPMTVIVDNNPDLILPYLSKMLKSLDNPAHDAVVRNTVRVLQNISIPEELEGEIYERCFDYLNDPREKPSIRAFSMKVLSNIAIIYPELKEELIKSIELHYPYGSKGFKSRAKKELKRLSS